MKILYLDDNHINRLVFGSLLEKKAEITLAESGPQALQITQQTCFDLIVLDLNLNDPKMDGFDVLNNLKKEGYTQNCTSKIYALTSYAGTDWEKKCLEAGFDRYFTKPINHNEILDKYLQEKGSA
jgi:two-component system, cell cycle response regulator DivK